MINSYAGANSSLDKIVIIVAETMPYLFIGFLLYLWFFKNKKNEVLYAGYTVVLGLIINQIIIFFYKHPRPFMENLGTNLLNHKPESSFPSDHVTFLFSIAFTFLLFKELRLLGIVSIFLGLLCGLGRVYCGVHWPFDIIGSIIVSIVATTIIFNLKNKINPLNNCIISIYNKILLNEK